jgi:hypothetical protein
MCKFRTSRQQYEFAIMWNWWVEIKQSYAHKGCLSDVEKRSLIDLSRWADEEALTSLKSSILELLQKNGITKIVRPYFESHVKSALDTDGVKVEIVDAMVRRANEVGLLCETKFSSRSTVIRNQFKCIKHGKGELYPHPRDKDAWEKHGASSAVHTFLPGYATGDRYTAILTMLLNPRLCLVIAYQEGNDTDQLNAIAAFDTVILALRANSIDPSERVCLLSHKGDLENARLQLNTEAGRARYVHQKGYRPPLLDRASPEHVYHISITTVMMAEAWGNDYTSGNILKEKSAALRARVKNMIGSETRTKIDGLVKDQIGNLKLRPGCVALWIANRPKANAREGEAISNPYMFEQIRYAIEATNRQCFHIADGFVNVVDGNVENRFRFKPSVLVDLGKFWDAPGGLLKARENQWYFLDTLFTSLQCHAIIGIRSGALEPIALFGHNVIYLEHSDMFTPERHGAWQGRIPYSRLVTCNRTGYYSAEHEKIKDRAIPGHLLQTEFARDSAIKELIGRNVASKKARGNDQAQSTVSVSEHEKNLALQEKIASANALIEEGVLLPTEIEILLKMVESKLPAFRVLND